MKIALLIFKSTFTILLLWLTLTAAQMGYANLYSFNAKNTLNSWIEKGAIPSTSSYNRAIYSINVSNEMHPNNPQYIETLGAIQEWGVYGEFAEATNFSLALENYNKAIQLRPLWPWSWRAKVMTKWRLGEIDDEMWHALVMLGKTGPYTKDANLTIVDVSLMMIASKSPYAIQAEELAAEHYRRAMGNSRAVQPLKAIIKRYEAETLVANW